MKVLILDNAIDHDVYKPVGHWKKFLDIPFDSFHASKGELPGDISQYTHVIITGSEDSITDERDWIGAEEEIIKKAVEDGKVVLGSCYGHQLLAKSLFGKKVVGKSKTPELGWDYLEIIRNDKLLGDAGNLLPVLLIHFDEVKNLPEDYVDILSSTKGCRIQAFKLKDRPVWGIQSHPEINVKEGQATFERMIAKAEKENSPRLDLFLKARDSVPKDASWFEGFMRKFQEISS